jgi:hypothetical protein
MPSLAGATILVVVVLLPLGGAAARGRDLHQVFEFPPVLNVPASYLQFSWWAVGVVLTLLAAVAVSWMRGGSRNAAGAANTGKQRETRGRFPWWGWAAVAWTLVWWVLAWTRFAWFETAQRFTFFPLWIGFIVTVNALVYRRSRSCLMIQAPKRWAALFGLSALFWWMFEWLNRFVRNWHYLGVEDFDAVSYAVHATLCFSTVLPAVASVAEWLETHPRWTRWVAQGPPWRWLQSRTTGWVLLVCGAAALGGAGAYPSVFYPALWIAPVALALGASVFSGRENLAGEIARGEWARAASWMTAALICGFFWELWNTYSAAKWIYTVPGVERWHVFEMPLLGYAGYLPFGLECLLVADHVLARSPSDSLVRD